MGKYSYGRYPIFDCCSMSTYIDTIGQPTHDKHIGALGRKITHHTLAKVAPIIGTLSCAYNTYYTTRVEGGISTIEEQDRRIVTFT